MSLSSGQTTGTHREQLIESHLPLVRSIAKRYAGRGESVDDLVQVGALGLIRASDRFDPSRGVTFATFATPAIEGEIRRHLGDQATSLRIPRELQRRTRQLGSARARLRVRLGRTPTVPELAEALGAKVEEVERTLEAERAREPAVTSADGAELEGPTSSATSEDRLLLVRGARVLDERERRIVLLRFHRDLTEQQIADELGISQAHVSRLLTRALAKLREELSENEPRAIIPNGAPPDEPVQSRASSTPGSQRKPASGSSGRFLVRMPGTLHEQLSQAAEREHLSLNRFITQTLTESVSGEDASVARDENESESPVATPEGQRRFRLLLMTNLVIIAFAVVVAIALLVLALDRGI
ncbi:MAG TPA: sigma-70 family RNA polymerase sigma factor [Solirubrobacteraceae bacterium]|nr:sigma-70 family RNA polymerase sigma factor [Solirubrobacteraceae bacterium]